MKLSFTMQSTLDAIRKSGGVAIPEGGGWWMGKNGERLKTDINPNTGHADEVITLTIYALQRRGLLRRTFANDMSWKDIYEVTVST